jgi:uracil-DNA glycosylase family 4
VAEMNVCSKHTETILDAINPEMVVAVGNTAITYFLGDTKLRPKDVIDTIIVSKERLKRKKGVTLRYVYCMRHPAYALHSRDPVIREQIEETIRHIPVALEKVRNIMKSKNRMKEKE